MPTYTFRNKETNEVNDYFMTIRAREKFVIDNPHLEQQITSAPPIGDTVRLGLRKTDDGFKEVLSKIHENNYKSNLNNKLSRN